MCIGGVVMSNISFTGAFDKYTPINGDPHYRFVTADDAYLISCTDYPALISELSPNDLVKIRGVLDGRVHEGMKLINVKFGELK